MLSLAERRAGCYCLRGLILRLMTLTRKREFYHPNVKKCVLSLLNRIIDLETTQSLNSIVTKR